MAVKGVGGWCKMAIGLRVQEHRNVHCWVSWSNELVVRQSPAGMNVGMEAETIVEIHHQATTSEDTAAWEDLVCAVVNCGVCELAVVLYLIVVMDL
jgi:hypothetical protein